MKFCEFVLEEMLKSIRLLSFVKLRLNVLQEIMSAHVIEHSSPEPSTNIVHGKMS